MRPISTTVVLACLTGCSWLSPRPSYRILPAASFKSRLVHYDLCKVRNTDIQEDSLDPDKHWACCYFKEISKVCIWHPSDEALKTAFEKVIKQYPVRQFEIDSLLKDIKKNRLYFLFGNRLVKNSVNMFRRTDGEHPRLLVPLETRDSLCSIDPESPASIFRESADSSLTRKKIGESSHPSLLSLTEPVGVSVTILTPEPATPQKEETSQINLINTLFGTPIEPKDKANVPDPLAAYQFIPTQRVHISVSTVLNSADLLDQIEYVSTYIYFDPYPGLPNGSVSIEDELWHRFFSLQAARSQPESGIARDLTNAAESLAARIVDVETTVKPVDKDFGTVKQVFGSSFSLTGKGTQHPEVTEIAPMIGVSSGSEVVTKILRQLDQRSTYISHKANFLRITQRGMSGVNAAGRFNERITLEIPAASDKILVVVPGGGKGGTDAVRYVDQPVYSRLDAVTFSVVVVRHPTRMRWSGWDLYGMPDVMTAADAAFVVYVSRPYLLTLWQWKRTLTAAQKEDILSDAKSKKDLVELTVNGKKVRLHIAGAPSEKVIDYLARMKEVGLKDGESITIDPNTGKLRKLNTTK